MEGENPIPLVFLYLLYSFTYLQKKYKNRVESGKSVSRHRLAVMTVLMVALGLTADWIR